MAKKKASKFEDHMTKYANVFGYMQLQAKHPEGRGDIEEVIPLAIAELKKQGLKDEDVEEMEDSMGVAYSRGDRRFLAIPLKQNSEKAKKDFQDFGKANLEGILANTPDQEVEGDILGYVVENLKTDDPKYKGVEKIVGELAELGKDMEKFRSKEGQEELAKRLIEEREAHYDQSYADKPELANVLKMLISPESVLNRFRNGYQKKQDELMKEIGDVRKYIVSTNPSGEDVAAMYEPIYQKIIQANARRQE